MMTACTQFLSTCLPHLHDVVRIEAFRLVHIVDSKPFFVKEIVTDDFSQAKLQFKCINAKEFAQCYKYFMGLPILEDDIKYGRPLFLKNTDLMSYLCIYCLLYLFLEWNPLFFFPIFGATVSLANLDEEGLCGRLAFFFGRFAIFLAAKPSRTKFCCLFVALIAALVPAVPSASNFSRLFCLRVFSFFFSSFFLFFLLRFSCVSSSSSLVAKSLTSLFLRSIEGG